MATTSTASDERTELSEKYEKLEGSGPEPYSAFGALKERIKLHYDLASDYYLSLWGEHIHHGYWSPVDSTITKEEAQIKLIELLLEISSAIPSSTTNTQPQTPLRILDVGCGIGGTSRYLAKTFGCHVTGITISTKQVEIAKRLSLKESTDSIEDEDGFISIKPSSSSPSTTTTTQTGKVKFIELDAEKMNEYFSSSTTSSSSNSNSNSNSSSSSSTPTISSPSSSPSTSFDIVWISEALSHFPNKPLFFSNAFKVLTSNGKLVLADWFQKENVTDKEFRDDIKPIEEGMLLPPLCTDKQYVGMAEDVGFKIVGDGPVDISKEVARTWDITWSLIQSPSLWAFAFSQGRDGVAFLQAFRAMRRGYANGTFRYAVMAFEKENK